MRIGLRVFPRSGWHRSAPSAGDLDVLIPLLAMNRAAVDFEMNVILFNLDERNVRRIARLDGGSPKAESLLHLFAIGRDHALLQLKTLGSHREGCPRVNQLRLKIANDVKTCFSGDAACVGGNLCGRSLRWFCSRILTVNYGES